MKVVYIAGPFRGPNAWVIEQNIRAAEETALVVWQMGAAVICPHTNTRFFQGAAPDELWLEGDLEMLKRCDAVLALPTYARSAGALAEIACAVKHNLPVFFATDELAKWLGRT